MNKEDKHTPRITQLSILLWLPKYNTVIMLGHTWVFLYEGSDRFLEHLFLFSYSPTETSWKVTTRRTNVRWWPIVHHKTLIQENLLAWLIMKWCLISLVKTRSSWGHLLECDKGYQYDMRLLKACSCKSIRRIYKEWTEERWSAGCDERLSPKSWEDEENEVSFIHWSLDNMLVSFCNDKMFITLCDHMPDYDSFDDSDHSYCSNYCLIQTTAKFNTT